MPIVRKTARVEKPVNDEVKPQRSEERKDLDYFHYSGPGMVEYALILVMVAVVVIASLIFIGANMHDGAFKSVAPAVVVVKQMVENKGFFNVAVSENDPTKAQESCQEGEYYYSVTAKNNLGGDVNLYVCAETASKLEINFR